MVFRFRLGGKDHRLNDPQCPGCEPDARERWPRPHRAYPGATCLGLVHAERFAIRADEDPGTIVWCDVCNARLKPTLHT